MSGFVQPTRIGHRIEREGITCAVCGCKMRVSYTRCGPGEKIRRVRICNTCGTRVQTYEIAVGSRTLEPLGPDQATSRVVEPTAGQI